MITQETIALMIVGIAAVLLVRVKVRQYRNSHACDRCALMQHPTRRHR